MSTRWFEISFAVPAVRIDEAAALLDLAGFGGVEVRERPFDADVVVVVEIEDDGAALPAALATKVAFARSAVEIVTDAPPQMTELDPRVWTENWKAHFARRTFAGLLEVRPPWEDAPPTASGLKSIVINPGMAFGTGLHETTGACLELIACEMRPGMQVADIGCGSGILAIAAALLGAAEVLATDVDPIAVDATNENVAANGVAAVVTVELEPGELGVPQWESSARPGLSQVRRSEQPRDVIPATRIVTNECDRVATSGEGGGFASRGKGSFDLVVANILAETLVEMRDSLSDAVREGGLLVLSGIEARRLKIVEEAFIRSPWRLARTVTRGDWTTICLHSALAERVDGLSLPLATKSE